jgi:hypothetical protein
MASVGQDFGEWLLPSFFRGTNCVTQCKKNPQQGTSEQIICFNNRPGINNEQIIMAILTKTYAQRLCPFGKAVIQVNISVHCYVGVQQQDATQKNR